MVTLFSKLLFYSTVIYWSSSLCFNPTHVAYNSKRSSAEDAVDAHATGQDQLAVLINRIAATTVSYWWQLLGEDCNNLSQLLDVSDKDI